MRFTFIKNFSLIGLALMGASFNSAAYDVSYLNMVKDDAGVQKCIKWKSWYPNRVRNNDVALGHISEMVRVTQDVYEGGKKKNASEYDITYRKIENGRYAMAWCKALPEPKRPYEGSNH